MSRDAEFAARWPLAQAYGWHIQYRVMCERGELVQVFDTVTPPPDYHCARHAWAASYETVNWQGEKISVPNWFWEDDVLRYGTRITPTVPPSADRPPSACPMCLRITYP